MKLFLIILSAIHIIFFITILIKELEKKDCLLRNIIIAVAFFIYMPFIYLRFIFIFLIELEYIVERISNFLGKIEDIYINFVNEYSAKIENKFKKRV